MKREQKKLYKVIQYITICYFDNDGKVTRNDIVTYETCTDNDKTAMKLLNAIKKTIQWKNVEMKEDFIKKCKSIDKPIYINVRSSIQQLDDFSQWLHVSGWAWSMDPNSWKDFL